LGTATTKLAGCESLKNDQRDETVRRDGSAIIDTIVLTDFVEERL